MAYKLPSLCGLLRAFTLSTQLTAPRAACAMTPLFTPRRTIIVADPSEVRLNNLRDNPGAVTKSVRLGRGIGTGTGKTSKRGHKGQKARTGTGKPGPGREGGQTPIYRTLRKFGFKNTMFARRLQGLNLDVLQHHINNQTINPYKKITIQEIFDAQCVGKKIDKGVKLLARGAEQFSTPDLHLEVSDCSSAARDAIEKLGGKVDLVYHNRLSLRYIVKPEKFYLKPTFARPPPKLHQSKYPNFPEPTPFTTETEVIDKIDYPPNFDKERKAEKKERREKIAQQPRKQKKNVRKEKKEKAIEKATSSGGRAKASANT